MKIILYLCSFSLLISCYKKTNKELPKGDFEYLIGNWERTNEQEGKKHSNNGNDQTLSRIKE